MARIWFILVGVSLFVSSSLSAQFNFYVGGGYNYGIAYHKQLDYIIGQYNTDNAKLVRPMPKLNNLRGPIFNMAFLAGNKSIHIDFSPKRAVLSSTVYNDQGDLTKTELQLKTNELGLTFGAFPTPGTQFAFGFGMTVKYLKSNYLLRGEEFGTKYSTWNSAASFDQLTVAPMIQVFFGLTENVFLYFNPAFQFDPFPINYYGLHQQINPNTYLQDKNRNMEGRLNQFVLEGGVVFSFQVGR